MLQCGVYLSTVLHITDQKAWAAQCFLVFVKLKTPPSAVTSELSSKMSESLFLHQTNLNQINTEVISLIGKDGLKHA